MRLSDWSRRSLLRRWTQRMECEMITLSKLGMKESNDLLLDVSRWEEYQLPYISGISAISAARCHQLTWQHVSSGSRTSSMIRSLQSVSLSTALFIQLWWYDLAIRLGRGAQLLRRKAVLVLFRSDTVTLSFIEPICFLLNLHPDRFLPLYRCVPIRRSHRKGIFQQPARDWNAETRLALAFFYHDGVVSASRG